MDGLTRGDEFTCECKERYLEEQDWKDEWSIEESHFTQRMSGGEKSVDRDEGWEEMIRSVVEEIKVELEYKVSIMIPLCREGRKMDK